MPTSDSEKHDGEKKGRDAYDWAVLAIAFLAFTAASTAAWFAWEQAAIARDNEQRALRAYVVITADLALDPKTKQPLVHLNADNMGQTPAYSLLFYIQTGLKPAGLSGNSQHDGLMQTDCRATPRESEILAGRTFGRSLGYNVGFADHETDGMRSLFNGGGIPFIFGNACYRDIFGEWHSVRICYEWLSEDQSAENCTSVATPPTPP